MKPLVMDELLALVGLLLPRWGSQSKDGRLWVDHRATLPGILYVLRVGIP